MNISSSTALTFSAKRSLDGEQERLSKTDIRKLSRKVAEHGIGILQDQMEEPVSGFERFHTKTKRTTDEKPGNKSIDSRLKFTLKELFDLFKTDPFPDKKRVIDTSNKKRLKSTRRAWKRLRHHWRVRNKTLLKRLSEFSPKEIRLALDVLHAHKDSKLRTEHDRQFIQKRQKKLKRSNSPAPPMSGIGRMLRKQFNGRMRRFKQFLNTYVFKTAA